MANFEVLVEDANDLLSSTPKSKFLDILNNANKDVLESELDNFITKFAIMEKLLEKNFNNEEIERKISQYKLENFKELEEYKTSIYIKFTADVVSKLEN